MNQVLILNKQRQESLKTIKSTTTKRVGSYLMQVSDEEKEILTQKTNGLYNSRIKAIYDNMNQELEKAGHEPLNNPYERG